METCFFYCDGSCKGKKGGYGIVSVWPYSEGDGRFLYQKYGGAIEGPSTNNIAELMAIKQCLILIIQSRTSANYIIRSDSMYSIKCITEWSSKWERNGWKTSSKGEPVANKELIVSILTLYRHILDDLKVSVAFEHVRGHSDDFYNDLCDEIADQFSS